MAIEVKIPREITEYKEKIMLGFTWRQAICVIACAAIGFTIFNFFYPYMSIDNATLLVVLCVLPIGLVGFVKYKDLSFEMFLYLWFKNKFIVPQDRYHDETDILGFIAEISVLEVENEVIAKTRRVRRWALFFKSPKVFKLNKQ